ncbi:response regulator [Pseudooceanicola nanhaiensis]|nr:response regulator [Pseudooceanicola nanhaiensis]
MTHDPQHGSHVTRVLIVEAEAELGRLWQGHLVRLGCETRLVHDQDAAVAALQAREYDVIVLDLILPGGAALAVSDYASYRQPGARVIFVTNSAFFSDGSIFNHAPNARALLRADGPPSDLAAIVEHYGEAG